jgi:hypothetical protein
MNKELIDKTLSELINGFIATKDFVLEQAPDVINQLLLFSLGQSIVWGIFQLSVVIAAAICLKRALNWKPDSTDDRLTKDLMIPVLFLTSGIFAISFLFTSVEILKISLAPKLFLLEYAANLLK